MKMVFAVFDIKAEAYLQPFFLDTTGQALRSIYDCIKDPNHQFGAHPEDYTLYYVGLYDQSTCEFTELQKTIVHTFLEIKASYERQQQEALVP